MEHNYQGLFLNVLCGWVRVVVQVSNKKVHTILSTEHSNVLLPLSSVAEEIGDKATVVC